MEHYLVSARDGDVGNVRNFLIDDDRWLVRYLVLKSGNALGTSSILLSGKALKKADWTNRRLEVALSLDDVKRCPNIEVDLPVSMQHERGGPYENEPYSWGFLGLWGQGPYPGLLESHHDGPSSKTGFDAHLRSAKELRGYAVRSDDQSLGSVEDFLVDDTTWQIHYVVVDAGAAWFSEKLFLPSHDVASISWTQKAIFARPPRALENADSLPPPPNVTRAL